MGAWLHIKFVVKAFFYAPITFLKRVVFGKDPYWRQYFWSRWGMVPQDLLDLVSKRDVIWIDALGLGEVHQNPQTGHSSTKGPGHISRLTVDQLAYL